MQLLRLLVHQPITIASLEGVDTSVLDDQELGTFG
jgi:hypothetical protein